MLGGSIPPNFLDVRPSQIDSEGISAACSIFRGRYNIASSNLSSMAGNDMHAYKYSNDKVCLSKLQYNALFPARVYLKRQCAGKVVSMLDCITNYIIIIV